MPLPGIAGMIRTINIAGPVVTINPDSVVDNHYGLPSYAERVFTLVSLIGIPSSWVWSIIAGTGSIISGGSTSTATIRTTGACTIRCVATIAGVGYSPEATMLYDPGTVGGGGGGGGGGGFGGGGGGGGELY